MATPSGTEIFVPVAGCGVTLLFGEGHFVGLVWQITESSKTIKRDNRYMEREDFMREAIRISRENMERGGGPFGAVIVRDGEIIARSGNTVALENDPTAHAEINAIQKASDYLNDFDLSGCELYSSCEPCPMCLGAIYWARIDRVWYAADRDDAAEAGFDDSFIYREMQKPVEERSIPTQQKLRDEALKAFHEWQEKEDKIQY